MIRWTPQHDALLEGLEAQHILPHLVCRLSRERSWLTPDEALRLVDWATSLREDPAWKIIEPVLEQPSAWPAIWREAVECGFAPQTDHHHALFFGRLFQRCFKEYDLERAGYAWDEMLHAWQRVARTTYLDELIADLTAGQSEEVQRRGRDVLLNLLDPFVEEIAERLQGALKIDDIPREATSDTAELDRRLILFTWDCLERASLLEGSSPLITQVAQRASQSRHAIQDRVVDAFARQVDAVDPNEPSVELIIAPFHWVARIFAILPISLSVATDVVNRTLDMIWKLRSLEHPFEKEAMARLLAASRPFNDALLGHLSRDDEAFGHHSQAADFLTFLGERATGAPERIAFFEHAIEICPGHRNASMMLSHTYIERANVHLLKTSAIPDIAGKRGPARDHIRQIVEAARDLVIEAERLYPHNEKLDKYREDVVKECHRFNIDPAGLDKEREREDV
ncbi:MAG: hypothetical protein ACNA8W_11925 [Bradymonadaceae bacterium]